MCIKKIENELYFKNEGKNIKQYSQIVDVSDVIRDKNINLISEIPDSQMTLYSLVNCDIYFDTKEELYKYVNDNNIELYNIRIIEYIGNFAGCVDVIKETVDDYSKFYTAIQECVYIVCNNKRNIYSDQFIWEYKQGNLKNIYLAFRERGIVFENYVYKEIDEKKYVLKHGNNKH